MVFFLAGRSANLNLKKKEARMPYAQAPATSFSTLTGWCRVRPAVAEFTFPVASRSGLSRPSGMADDAYL